MRQARERTSLICSLLAISLGWRGGAVVVFCAGSSVCLGDGGRVVGVGGDGGVYRRIAWLTWIEELEWYEV
jgi:hypothetical protein